MVRKLLFAISLFLLSNFTTYSQNVTWGPVIKGDYELFHRQFISLNPDHYLTLRRDGTSDLRAWNNFGTFKLDRYDKAFNQVLSVPLLPTLGKRELRPEFGLDLKNNLYIVSSNGDQKARMAYYYHQKIDPKTLQLGEPVQFGEGPHNQFVDASFCSYRPSADSTHVLIVTENSKSQYSNSFGIYILDKDMKPELAKRIELPIPAKDCELVSCFIDDLSNAYLVIESKSGDYDKPAWRAKQVYCVKNKTGELIKLPIKVEGGTLTDVMVEETPNQSIICIGMYSSQKRDESNGYVYTRFNKQTLAVEATISQPFSSKFVGRNISESDTDNGAVTSGLDSYFLHSVIPMANGKTMLLAERKVINNGGSSTHYSLMEIAAVMVDDKGNFLWAKKIPKRQTSSNHYWYSSFGVMRGENEVILVYYDAPKNIEKGLEETPEKSDMAGANFAVFQAVIKLDGTINRSILISNAELKNFTLPASAIQVNSKQMLMCGKDLTKYFYGIATF